MSKNNPAIKTEELFEQEILKKVKNNGTKTLEPTKPQHLSEIDNKWNMNNKIIELFAKSIEKDQELKEKYAIILLVILAVELVALITIFILKGLGILNYSDATFNLFITGGIAEVFVLVRVIVKYLFKDNLTKALNIILESNNQKRFKKHNKKKDNNIPDKP